MDIRIDRKIGKFTHKWMNVHLCVHTYICLRTSLMLVYRVYIYIYIDYDARENEASLDCLVSAAYPLFS